jgi:hypothetical protein
MEVYKYYSPVAHNFEAIKEGYFFFCKVSKLNDPFDASYDLIQSSKFKEMLHPYLAPNAKAIMDDYGTCSFCEEPNNKVLWALYASNYSGFVVVFDDSTFESLNLMLQARISYQKVVYNDESPNLDDINYTFEYRDYEGNNYVVKLRDCLKDEKTMDKLFTHLCSYKNNIWKNEKEWRLIAGNDIAQRENSLIRYEADGYKIPIPSNAIKSIIIGHNFPKDKLCCIKEVSSNKNIPIMHTKIGMPFEIEFEEIAL